MAFLKQHRKATLELDGRKLTGNFSVSLTNERDREALVEMVTEIRKQLREFDPSKPRKKTPQKKLVLRGSNVRPKVRAKVQTASTAKRKAKRKS